MKRLFYIIGLNLIVLGSLLGFRACQKKHDSKTSSAVLGPNTAEKLIVDGLRHTITIVKPEGTTVTSLPIRPSSVEIMKDGKVIVTAPQYGFEAVPFIGIGYSSQLNDYIGCDLYYWKRLDLGVAFSFDRELKIKALGFPVVLSYAIWHNTRLSIGLEPVGPSHSIHGMVSVRL